MATRNQLNPPPLRKITDFKSKLSGGGARSNLFECELAFPQAVNVEGLNDILNKETNTEVIHQWVDAHSKKSEEDWRPRLFSKTKTESKCPFSFLFK